MQETIDSISKSIAFRTKRRIKFIYLALSILFTILVNYVYIQYTLEKTGKLPAFSIMMPLFIIYLFSKLICALLYKPSKTTSEKGAKVSIVIPYFNEEPKIVEAQLISLQQQTHTNWEVHYIDDGCFQEDIRKCIESFRAKDTRIHFHQLPENRGKRDAQAYVVEKLTGSFIFVSDSDSVLEKNCLEALLEGFIAPDVLAVTGRVVAYNPDVNLLTRILNVRYFNAFEMERAAHHYTGDVLVCSGPNTMYRTSFFKRNKKEYVNQYFLGKKQTYGDDRCMTNFALNEGRTRYQSNAICFTEVPTTLQKFTKQQVRWGRSFFRESYLALKMTYKHKKVHVVLWTFLEVLMMLVFWYTFIFYFISFVRGDKGSVDFAYITVLVIINSYIRNIFYAHIRFRDFSLAPIYGFLHIILVAPLKLYSLLTLRDTRWMTR